MKQLNLKIFLGTSFLVLSAIVYFIQVTIFRRPHDTFFYMLQDLAFVPVQVLLVTMIISGLLDNREKSVRLEKLNMVIGAFFSEVGTNLLAYFSDFDPNIDRIRKNLFVANDWSKQEFFTVAKRLKDYKYDVEVQKVNLEDLRILLVGKRDFLVRLLENPFLLEHESFTELLRAVFHLTEELAAREDLRNLPNTDYEHLRGDVIRAYVLLAHQWLDYMKHLKNNYPYLFSLSMRTNPFDQNASPIVR